ncbi:hypothetical protein RVR_3214 [Actinacidiphila reveromycinica]|uniref:DUF397 domain-containing protein n=1 Tax=Actinacidiphila reveromycinica TaxID=659352 RepID=A0A7U3UND8_9ACTN|nr:DUF397 domain-containing protein [Streptomyces sp. SN-593]BBA97455.1 hypothetical protein RVR_3214 [Streptomyces sp. SN-593]
MAPDSAWHKSSYSGGSGDSCVEAADVTATHGGIGVRDSKDPQGPALLFTPTEWTSFVALLRTGTADFGTV